jgi:DinB superfamily
MMPSAANPPEPALAPELTDLRSQFAAAKEDAGQLVDGLRESQFNWRPDAQGWSMAECLQHLNMVGDQYLPVLEKAIEEARARGRLGHGPFRVGPLSRWILGNTEPPPRRTFHAPRSLTPAYGQPLTAVMPTFRHLQDQLARAVEQAGGLDLGRIKISAPGLGPVRLSLYVTFAWIAAHQRRHLWQARQVRNHPAFPRQA